MAEYVFTDAEGAVRTFLRANCPSLEGRVFFALPSPVKKYPLAVIGRVGGSPQLGEAPVEDVRLSIDVWGGDSKFVAVGSLREVLSAVAGITEMALDDTCRGMNGTVNSVVWLPEDEQERHLARYNVLATVTVAPVPVLG